MKIIIFYHSTTGNTKLSVDFLSNFLKTLEHEVKIVNILKQNNDYDINDFDLIGVAAPTMYYRAITMERFLEKLPVLNEQTPAFLLASCAGEPGAQFAIQAEILNKKNIAVLGAHWVVGPSNWPHHRILAALVPFRNIIAPKLKKFMPFLRLPLSLIYPEAGIPTNGDIKSLKNFMYEMLHKTMENKFLRRPSPSDLHKGYFGAVSQGRNMDVVKSASIFFIKVDEKSCTKCGVCVNRCPEKVMVFKDDGYPVVGNGCVGCFTCYNHCAFGSIKSLFATKGRGRYPAPPAKMRAIFKSNEETE